VRTITAVTVGRSDWGIFRPVLQRILKEPHLELRLVVSGAHLSQRDGHSIDEIRSEGFDVAETVDMLLESDTPVATSKAIGLGTIGFADAYQRIRPDILLLLGDRFEMLSAALAAVPMAIPMAHIHGGEVTHGAIDDAFRHSMTKYSHLHFASTREHADRIMQLGEEPWRITVSGAPAIDNLKTIPLISRDELADSLDIDLCQAPLIVTYHPVTRQLQDTARQVDDLTAALAELTIPIVITHPNADPQHSVVTSRLEEFKSKHENVRLVSSLGTQRYFSLMRDACAMVGNSSSGIIEAAMFRLPVVNIGPRQSGRPRSANVIDVNCTHQEISAGISKALSPEFKASAEQARNIYGSGDAAEIIVKRLGSVELNDSLLLKRFHDLSGATTTAAAA
jgi:UDP-hydrolysing UDP-N-acetyl-D-glucosamine 2-epimerase